MPSRRLLTGAIVLALAPGCHHLHKAPRHPADPDCPDDVVRVKAPPQRIAIELPPGRDAPEPPAKKESADLPPRRPTPEGMDRGAPESAGRPESVAGTLAAVGQGLTLANQIAGFSRTTALTNPLGTVTPGSAGLGIGIRWIHIPIPFPRLFSVQETPSVTIPLSEANLVPQGVAQHGLVGGARGITREELAALVEQEIAARNRAARRDACPPADDEKKRLEKKLAEAEGKIERLSKVLDALDDKLTAPAGGWGPAGGRPAPR
ncbi:MAG: hypothetical protein C0501_30695 [Isosphaera sp.]|nr:hypothetical protein [Isosphaera sp.]